MAFTAGWHSLIDPPRPQVREHPIIIHLHGIACNASAETFVMTLKGLAPRDSTSHPNLKLICWTVSTLAGGAVVLTALLLALRQLQRRRKSSKQFEQACLRDPSLIWDEYERRGRLTRSRLIFEDEIQRSIMIRKCQQSRASDCKDDAPGVQEAVTRPTRSRYRNWHGRSKSEDCDATDVEQDVEQGHGLPRENAADWESAEASVDRTWQLLHRHKPPPYRNRLFWNENGKAACQRLPAVRPKTPPLLSHPLFRSGDVHYGPRHISLPTELTRATRRTDPMGSSRQEGGPGDAGDTDT